VSNQRFCGLFLDEMSDCPTTDPWAIAPFLQAIAPSLRTAAPFLRTATPLLPPIAPFLRAIAPFLRAAAPFLRVAGTFLPPIAPSPQKVGAAARRHPNFRLISPPSQPISPSPRPFYATSAQNAAPSPPPNSPTFPYPPPPWHIGTPLKHR
jgi:hypothetical protein